MKRFKFGKLAVMLLLCSVLMGGCGEKESDKSTTSDQQTEGNKVTTVNESGTEEADASVVGEYLSGKHTVDIVVKDKGTIRVELDADVAPITVTNFVKLVKEGFYDGLTFHRIMDGFMMQGGDPTGTGRGGSDETIKGEFAINGIENNLSHTRGAISMARSQENNSASSQFFIVHEDSTYLDGQYACFGYVTEGMEVVDEICENAIVEDWNGTVLAKNQPVIESITIVE